MSVVVNDRNALFKAEFFKTALCSAELIKSLLYSGEVRAEITCSRNCRKGVTNYQDAKLIAELSEDLGEAMVGINESEIEILMAERGK